MVVDATDTKMVNPKKVSKVGFRNTCHTFDGSSDAMAGCFFRASGKVSAIKKVIPIATEAVIKITSKANPSIKWPLTTPSKWQGQCPGNAQVSIGYSSVIVAVCSAKLSIMGCVALKNKDINTVTNAT